MNKKNLLRLFSLSILILLLAILVFPYGVGFLIDLPKIKSLLAQRIEKATGLKVKIDHIKLDLATGISLKAERVILKRDGSEHPLLDIKTIRSSLDLFELIKGRISFNGLELNEPVIEIDHPISAARSGNNLYPLYSISFIPSYLTLVFSRLSKDSPFPSIGVSGGEIWLYGRGISLTGLSGRITGIKEGEKPAFHFKGLMNLGSQDISIEILGGSGARIHLNDPEALRWKILMKIKDLPIMEPLGLIGIVPAKSRVDGLADLRIKINGQGDGSQILSGKLMAKGLSAAVPGVFKKPIHANVIEIRLDAEIARNFLEASLSAGPLPADNILAFTNLPPDSRVSGEIDLKAIVSKRLDDSAVIKVSLKAYRFFMDIPRILTKPFSFKRGFVSFEGRYGKQEIAFNQVKLLAPPFRIKGRGRILLNHDSHSYQVELAVSPFDFKEVIPFLGKELIGEGLYGFLRSDLKGGKSTGAIISIRSEDDPTETDFSMRLGFSEVTMFFDEDQPPLADLQGSFLWTGDRMRFMDLKATYNGHPFRRMEAEISNIGVTSHLKGRFELKMGLDEAIGLFGMVGASADRSQIEAFQGDAFIDTSIEKDLLGGKGLDFSGKMDLIEGGFRYPSQDLYFNKLRGSVIATPSYLRFENISGQLQGSPFELNGGLQDWREGLPRLDLSGTISISGDTIKQYLPERLSQLKINTKGRLEARFAIRGDPRKPIFRVSADATAMALGWKDVLTKDPGEDLRLSFWILPEKQGSILLKEGKLIAEGSAIEWEALFRTLPQEELILTAKGEDIFLESLAPMLPFLEKTGIKGKIKGEIEVKVAEDISFAGLLRPNNVLIPGAFPAAPLRISGGSIQLLPEEILIDPLNIMTGGDSYLVRGVINGWKRPYDISLAISGSGFMLPLERKGPKPGQKKSFNAAGLFHTLQRWIRFGNVIISLDRALLYDLSIHNSLIQLIIEERGLRLFARKAIVAQGSFKGQAVLEKDDRYRLRGLLSDAKAEEIFRSLGVKNQLLQGGLRASFELNGAAGGDEAQKTAPNGVIEFRIEKGIIKRFAALSSILSILNVSQIFAGNLPDLSKEGLPFHQIEGHFRLAQGILKTEDTKLSSEAMGISMVGTIDLARKSCDLKVGIQPLVTIDRIVNKIPVVRHYLAGENRTVFAIYFLVKGSLDNPEVTPIPFRSLGHGIIGIFERLFQNPFK